MFAVLSGASVGTISLIKSQVYMPNKGKWKRANTKTVCFLDVADKVMKHGRRSQKRRRIGFSLTFKEITLKS